MAPEIGLSGLLLDYPRSGMATYTRQLARTLPEVAPDLSFRLYLREANWSDSTPASCRLSSPLGRYRDRSVVGARLDKLVWETVMLPAASRRYGDRLLHSLYFAAPLIQPCPTLVTVHDLIPLVVAGYHRGTASRTYAHFMEMTVRRAAAIVTVSEHARQDIVRILKFPEDRIFVTPEAADQSLFLSVDRDEEELARQRYRLPQRYFLYLGGAEKRKNLEMLVRAWARVDRAMSDRDVALVLATGFPEPDALYPDVPGLIHQLGLAGRIHIVGSVDEEHKAALYRHALGFCFPSKYEGFGLPPLEAMAAGVPVITSNATSLPEVVGEGGIQLPQDDEAAWAEAMLRLVDSPSECDDWSRRGRERAAEFSWERTARQTADIYRWLLGR